jgi:hypothetical protein
MHPAHAAALDECTPLAVGQRRWLWVRDVGCDEDTARPGGKAPGIWAILTGFLSPRVRPLACRTRPQGVRARTHQLEKVDAILTQGVHPPQ